MTEKVLIKALRPFEGEEGYKDENSEPFEVNSRRYSELKANGLAAKADGEDDDTDDGGQKQAEEPANKKAAEPANKAAVDPLDHDANGRKGGSVSKAVRGEK